MADVKVTVLMPAYNAGKYIGEAIRSVLAQDYAFFELLIINDGSTDETRHVINNFNDSRIRVIHQENQGISAALNKGLAASRGAYIARFDADDICMPERLKIQTDFLDNNPDCFICGSDAAYITEEGEHLFDFNCRSYTHDEIIKNLYTTCPLIHSAAMFRKDVIMAAGGYPLYAYSFEDHLLWILLKDKGLFHNIRQQLVKIRFSASSFTMDEKWRGKQFRQLKKEILKKGSAGEEEGKKLLAIIREQEDKQKAAYYALCGKKLLVNNHRPAAARSFLKKAIGARPLRPDNYLLYGLSFFPKNFIGFLYKASKVNH